MAQQQLTNQQEKTYQTQLRQLKQQMPDLVHQDKYTIADPTDEHPFTLPPAQRMDPLDVTIEQVACGQRALAARRRNTGGIKMKRVAKQVANKIFNYTQNEKETAE